MLNRNYKETAASRQGNLVATATANVMHTNIGKELGSLSQTGSTCLSELFHGGALWLALLRGRLNLKGSEKKSLSTFVVFSYTRAVI